MTAIRRVVAFLAFAATLAATLAAQGPEELRRRRAACREQMAEDQVLVLKGTAERDARPDSNLYYLTGMTRSGAALILAGGGGEILFVPQERRRRGRITNAPGPLAGAGAAAGIVDVRYVTALQAELDRLASEPLSVLDDRKARSICGRVRRIKSPAEIERLKTAIDITCAAHAEVMRSARPGMFEYQLQAIIEYVFAFNGAERTGFPSIVGSGPNACILHWSENSRRIEPGDVVVMDIGAEYGMYTADVTRTIPIDGVFTDRQRQIYEIVLAANEAAIAMIAPGVEMRDVSARASEVLAQRLAEIGMIEEGDRRGLRKYYYHRLSHPIGLVVHDVGGLGTLEPGMVITIEPGLYLREENMGFRIEDDILVTEDGHVNLSAAAPKTVAAIEAMMAETGIDVSRFRVDKTTKR